MKLNLFNGFSSIVYSHLFYWTMKLNSSCKLLFYLFLSQDHNYFLSLQRLWTVWVNDSFVFPVWSVGTLPPSSINASSRQQQLCVVKWTAALQRRHSLTVTPFMAVRHTVLVIGLAVTTPVGMKGHNLRLRFNQRSTKGQWWDWWAHIQRVDGFTLSSVCSTVCLWV